MNSSTRRRTSAPRTLALVLSLMIAASACSGNKSETSATTTEPTTTTIAADCTDAAVERAMGEPGIVNCHRGWAAVQPSSYAGSCSECESVWLYEWEDNDWNLRARCNQFVPLMGKETSSCTPLSGDIQAPVETSTLEVPPTDVACVIWHENTQLRNIAQTGCTASASDITYDTTEQCDQYYPSSYLPLGRCDQGRGVRSVQKRLIAQGAQIDYDGFFGPGTVRAVMDFQTRNGLVASGWVDEETWRILIPNQESLPGADFDGNGLITPDEYR